MILGLCFRKRVVSHESLVLGRILESQRGFYPVKVRSGQTQQTTRLLDRHQQGAGWGRGLANYTILHPLNLSWTQIMAAYGCGFLLYRLLPLFLSICWVLFVFPSFYLCSLLLQKRVFFASIVLTTGKGHKTATVPSPTVPSVSRWSAIWILEIISLAKDFLFSTPTPTVF